ncbi:MAG TPA: hypothetical protein VF406_14990 [Thermodesulfobacteriota bacterium]
MERVEIRLVDSVTRLDEGYRGMVVVSGSHGGGYAAYIAALGGVRGVVFNDAGVGKEGAGVAGLGDLDALGIAAAAVDHRSARIGDAADAISNGRISHVNRTAAALGCTVGQSCRDCAERMTRAPGGRTAPIPRSESRVLLRSDPGEPMVWGLDSASLVRPEDAGQIVVTGSHGGLLGGRPETALRVDALAAVYNDAGVGAGRAGVSRLPALDARGIAAATVAAESARIGDARSTYVDGRISHVNRTAAEAGAAPGMRCTEFVGLFLAHRPGLPRRPLA